jgi:hypothetical protein
MNGAVTTRLLACLLFGAVMVVAQGARGDAPQPAAEEAGSDSPPEAALPVGKWKVEFANGVIETCHAGNGGEATVEEHGCETSGDHPDEGCEERANGPVDRAAASYAARASQVGVAIWEPDCSFESRASIN